MVFSFVTISSRSARLNFQIKETSILGKNTPSFILNPFSEGGNVDDSISLIMQNLKEMNRLWIRIKSIRAFKKVEREKQRMDLKVTVGENIVRLSRLEGVDLEKY